MKRVAVWNSGDRWNDPNLVYGPLEQPAAPMKAISKDNLISAVITAAAKAAAIQKIKDSRDQIPVLGSMENSDKGGFQVIGTARAGMDQTFIRHMQDHPELMPGFINPTEVVNDKEYRCDLIEIRAVVKDYLDALDDTISMASHDSYMAYRAIYDSVKAAAARGVPAADVLLPEEAAFFENISLGMAKAKAAKKAKTTPPPAA